MSIHPPTHPPTHPLTQNPQHLIRTACFSCTQPTQPTHPPLHHSSFFQSLCILGYCVFPLDIAALVNLLIGLAFQSVIVKTLVVAIGFAWATRGKPTHPPTHPLTHP